MLTDIIDVCSRKIIGREITKIATTDDAITAIKRALMENRVTSNLILRSDNDSQFISIKFEHLCKVNNIYHERIFINLSNYNAYIESIHFLCSKEWIAWDEIKNFTDGYRLIDEYIKFYNEERIHGSLNYISLNQFIDNESNIFPLYNVVVTLNIRHIYFLTNVNNSFLKIILIDYLTYKISNDLTFFY